MNKLFFSVIFFILGTIMLFGGFVMLVVSLVPWWLFAVAIGMMFILYGGIGVHVVLFLEPDKHLEKHKKGGK